MAKKLARGYVGGVSAKNYRGMALALFLGAVLGLSGSCGESSGKDSCWAPFEPVAENAGMLEAPADARLLKCRPGDAETVSQRELVVGDLRISLLSPTLVRLEARGAKGFEDRCTFVVVDRDWPGVAHEVSKTGADTVIDAGSWRVIVPGDGKSIAGTRVVAPDGSVLYEADGKAPPKAFLPGPAEQIEAWVMGDMPRIIPPEWGATPPPSPEPDSGWDKGNDATDVYVFIPGDGGYRQLRADLLKLTGPVELPPLYTFGLWMSRYYEYTEQTALETIDGFRTRGIPLDLLVVDTDWRVGGSDGYQIDTTLFPDMERFLASAHERNARIMFNDHPEPKGAALDQAELQYRWDGLTKLLELGVDAWWYDRNWWTSLAEPAPGIAKEVWGMRLYHDVTETFRPKRRPLIMSNVEGIDNGILNQPSSPAAHRFPIWWTGDTRSTWGALKVGIENGVLSGLLSLLPYVNEDAGGHQGDPGAELYTRFMQFASLSPVTRPHCTKGQKRLPWEFGPETEQVVTDYIRLRYRLLPTIYAAARRAYDDGTPLMRRLDLEWPEYEEAKDSSQYLLGDDLLVAPMHGNPAALLTSDEVKTPAGAPGFRGEYFDNIGLEGEAEVVRTDEQIDFDWGAGAPADGLPVDEFSVRWTGKMGPVSVAGKALFAVTGDDGYRLWINDKKVIDGWVDQAATERTAVVEMEAGKTYTIKLEYYEKAGNASCELSWQPPGHPATNTRSLWLPPGLWHDAWTGELKAGPATLELTLPLEQMPLFFRDGGVIATIPQLEYSTVAVWPKVVLDVFVPAEAGVPLRTERFIYEDDGASPGYRMGEFARTPVVLERGACGTRLVLGPTAGTCPELPKERTWVLRLHLAPGAAPDLVTVDGRDVIPGEGSGPYKAALLAPAAGEQLPLAGEGTSPAPKAGPVLEIVVSNQDLRQAVEILLPAASAR